MKKKLLLLFFNYLVLTTSAQSGWYEVPGAPQSSRFEDVSFIGSTGWVAQNMNWPDYNIIIHKTTDKGDHWTAMDTIVIPGNYCLARSVEFINDSIGLIGMLPDSLTPTMYRTADGGNSFTPVSSPAFSPKAGVCGMAHYGNIVTGVGKFAGERKFYKSMDAGLTWTMQQLDSQIVGGLVDIYMFNDQVYIASGTSPFNNGRRAVILKTIDGGSNWQLVAQSTDSAVCFGWKIQFYNGGKGVVSIERSDKIFMTSDSGSTWNEVYVGMCPVTGWNSVEYGGIGFLNDTLGWVADQHNSQCWSQTTDGGLTWQLFSFGYGIDRMVILDSVTMLAVGGTIYKYSFDSVTTSISSPSKYPKAGFKLRPTPANEEILMDIKLQRSTTVKIQLVNAQLNLVKELPEEYLDKGDYTRKFSNTGNLPAGIYFVVVYTQFDCIVEKAQIVH